VHERLFAFCEGLVSRAAHFITLRDVPYFASGLLLERDRCPRGSVLLVCESPLGEKKIVVKFTSEAELAARELEVGAALAELGLHVPVAGSKCAVLRGFDAWVGYTVAALMELGDVASFLCEQGENLFDTEPEVYEPAQRELLGRCVDIGRDVIPQLNNVHHHGWLHCDIKPNNILAREEDGRVRYWLADWDHAVKIEDAEKGAPVAGTEHYEAPEARAQGRVGRKFDVFGLGATLFYVCAGVPPKFKDGALMERPSWLPDALWKLLSDMMRKNPQDRPLLDECLTRLESMEHELQ
jgi:serine/threonine protein kinase